MDKKRQIGISKFLSLILRHKPEKIGLKLDEYGWVNVEELLAACAKNGKPLTRRELEEIVAENDKKRFSFDETRTRIRANQGHSITVDLEFEQKIPPEILYHGTAQKNVDAILKNGLTKMRRHHVHLSSDKETARKVGMRYGKPVIFEIETKAMIENNFEFFVSTNGVWLVENVPPQFLRLT